MVRKTGCQVAATPLAKFSEIATGPKKTVKPKADACQSKRVAKPTTNSRPGDRTPSVLAQVPIHRSRSTDTSGKEVPTTSALTAPPESAKLAEDSAEVSMTEIPPTLPEYLPAGVAPAPDSNVIEIEDEPEEPEKKGPLVGSASKRKGKEKVQGSPKRAHFATDPREYALTRASEAELLFGRQRFVLPTVPVTQGIQAKPSLPDSDTLAAPFTGEPVDRSPVVETEARWESGAGLIFEDQLLVEPKASLSPGDALGCQDHLETEAANLLDPVQEGSNPTGMVVSPGTERLGETSASRPGVLIDSLREGLLACPLETLMEILPEGSSYVLGIGSQ
jgi:hypothetical protein